MSSDQRQPSSSSRPNPPARIPSEADDVTWSDFLRTAGGTTPLDPSNSADRKRRHTGGVGSPEERRYPYHLGFAAGRRAHPGMNTRTAGARGDTTGNPVDIASPARYRPQRPQVPQRGSGSSETMRRAGGRPNATTTARGSDAFWGRSDSEIVLPKWQSDSEVSQCPVCKTDFSFWYRKHHCRKCGRVVCAACSPHRITIPRQYIVQNSLETEQSPASPTTSSYPRNLGGGEVVRVCNPCVPDPWTPSAGPEATARSRQEDARRRGSRDELRTAEHYPYAPVPPLPPEGSSRARAQSHQPATGFNRPPLPHGHPNSGFVFRAPPVPSNSTRPTSHRYTQSFGHNASPHPIPHFSTGARPTLPTPTPSAPPQPRPRREVREEDECPVCGTEMPPGEDVREAHIQQCISARFLSRPSNSTPPQLLHSLSNITSSSAPTHPTPSTSTPPTGSEGDASRPRATSYRPRGMALYRATEKDCMTEEGDAQECVICFEEFQPGDEMGRMECLCKFHRVCIRGWWERKGAGSCPTHMLHD